MKKVRIFSLLLCLVLCTGLFSIPVSAAAPTHEVAAKAALLLDPDTGEVLLDQDADTRQYPASLTKVMTALLVFEAIDRGELKLEQQITASSAAFTGLDSAGSTADVSPGEVMTVEELLACMLINSANEAAAILAVATAGDVASFVERMNARATELGCENTHFVNPTGLHNAEHYTTAWDLSRIVEAALQYDHFMELCNSKSYEIPATNLHEARTLHSTNYLISNWRALGYLYSGARGVKTGHTSQAGNCLITTATRDDRTLLSVVLGAGTEEGTGRVGSFTETSKLLDWGFTSFHRVTLVTKDDLVAEARVGLSRETNYVTVHPAKEVQRLLPVDLETEDLVRSIALSQEIFNAPITAGDVMGTLTLRYGDTDYATVDLLASNAVSASWSLTLHYRIVQFFSNTVVKLLSLVVLAILLLLFVQRNGRRRSRQQGNPTRSARNYRGRRRV